MWWCKMRLRHRRFPAISALLLLTLASCGFTPLYGGGGPMSGSDSASVSELYAIRILPAANREGQVLYNRLRDLINPKGVPADPRYLLELQITQSTDTIFERRDQTASRVNLQLTVPFTLMSAIDRTILHEGNVRVTTSYNILNSPYATEASREEAFRRALGEVAEQIRLRLGLYFHEKAGG